MIGAAEDRAAVGRDRPPVEHSHHRHNVLVVSTVEEASASLRRYLDDEDAVKVVVPVVRQGFLDWLANDERAFARAQVVAERTADELPGRTVDSRAGEADLDLAIRDALATFPADEIVVAIGRGDDHGLIQSLTAQGARGRVISGIPVRCVLVDD